MDASHRSGYVTASADRVRAGGVVPGLARGRRPARWRSAAGDSGRAPRGSSPCFAGSMAAGAGARAERVGTLGACDASPRVLLNTPDIELWPGGLLRARSNHDARVLSRALRVLRRKRDGRFLAAELPEGLMPLVPSLQREDRAGRRRWTRSTRSRRTRAAAWNACTSFPSPACTNASTHSASRKTYARTHRPVARRRARPPRLRRLRSLPPSAVAAARRRARVAAPASRSDARGRRARIDQRLSHRTITSSASSNGSSRAGRRSRRSSPSTPRPVSANTTAGARSTSARRTSRRRKRVSRRRAHSRGCRRTPRAHGFVLSYPRDNPHGIVYEPWHWCWRGWVRRTLASRVDLRPRTTSTSCACSPPGS